MIPNRHPDSDCDPLASTHKPEQADLAYACRRPLNRVPTLDCPPPISDPARPDWEIRALIRNPAAAAILDAAIDAAVVALFGYLSTPAGSPPPSTAGWMMRSWQ